MNADEILQLEQYSLPQPEKDELLVAELNRLTEHHRRACPAYARILSVLAPDAGRAATPADVPWLPVGLFKAHELSSVAPEAVFKTLTSSGTTSSEVSRIVLDAESAARQTRALASVMTHVLGPDRLPMIIVDSRSTISNRRSFSARGAGILGMATYGRNHFYALDDEMRLDREGLEAFLQRHDGSPLLIFGFTFMVWQYLLQALEPGAVDLSRATLVHSGGWKKLQEVAVGNAEFKAAFRHAAGLERIYNFYGMVEQIGSVYLECEEGHLHAPNFGDVIVRDSETWQPVADGEPGVIQVLSVLPTSYPGHSILTEDLGSVVTTDGCGCGRRGKAIALHGRVPKSELRGCSDTHAADRLVAAA